MIVDLETQNNEYYGQLASPHHPENYIVAPAFALDSGPVQHWYFKSRAEADASDWFRIPDSVKILVAHNATFELHWFMHRHMDELMKFLKRGGRIFCTQYAEYILSMQQELYPKLDETAPKYGGTHKIDAVKVLWEQGYKTSEIDQQLLIDYLAGPEGDICNTRLCYYGQYQKLKEAGMLDMFWLRMDSLLHKAFCTFFGMKVDRARAEADQLELREKVDLLRMKLSAHLPPLPEYFEFNWGSDYHVSALLFGGPVKYQTKVPYGPPKFEKVDCYQFKDSSGFIPVAKWDSLSALAQSEMVGFHGELVRYRAGVNKGQLKVFREDSDVPKLKWADAQMYFPGIVNLGQLPAHVSQRFTGKRAEFKGKRFLCDDATPVYSTGSDALQAIKDLTDSPLPGLLLELAGDEKILGTFYDGMLQYLTPEDVIYHNLNIVSTGTTRLSSSRPNMQQIPRDGDVKKMFVSRFQDGLVIECDYTALEVVHLACLSGDKALLEALIAGTDMHTLRLSKKLREDYDALRAIVKDEDHPRHEEIKDARQGIKGPSFAYQYGATAGGISFATGMSVEEAQAFIDNENELFPESSKYRHVVAAEVERNSHQPGMFNREQAEDGSWRIYRKGYFVSPSSTRFCFRQRDQWADNGQGRKEKVLDFKITEMANYPVQGEASFVMQVADGLIIRWLIKEDFYGFRVLPINSVHDATYMDAAPELYRMAALHVKRLMEYAPKYIGAIFPAYNKLGIQDIPYPAVPEAGPNMKEKKHVE
jgi:DNA polymerase I-like protein with 3'-5' exonuclease and polymerase domains